MARWWNVGALVKPRQPSKRTNRQPPVLAPSEPANAPQPLTRAHGIRQPDTDLPRFQSTASDQPSTRSGTRLSHMRSKLRHAFTPSQPVGDRRMFAGREETLRTVIRAIEDQRLHVVIYGERGIGKTSILHMLTQAASEARYIVIYTSCGANSNFDDTFRAAAHDIPILFHSGFAPTTEQAEKGATLADLLPAGPVTPRLFSDLCAKLTGTRVLIVLDEFDRCEAGAFRRDIAELIKNLSDRLGRVQLVLAGVAADLTGLVAHIPSIRRNILALRVPKMTDEEILEIVANGEREVGMSFEPAASELIVAVSRGSPYVANLLGHHSGQYALQDSRATVTSADVALAVDQVQVEFQARLGKAISTRLRTLVDLGHGEDLDIAARTALSAEGAFGIREMLQFNDVDAAKAGRILERLVDDGLLVLADEDEGGKHYEFLEEGLPTYLWITATRANLRPEQARARVRAR